MEEEDEGEVLVEFQSSSSKQTAPLPKHTRFKSSSESSGDVQETVSPKETEESSQKAVVSNSLSSAQFAVDAVPAFAELLNSLESVSKEETFEKKVLGLISEFHELRNSRAEGQRKSEQCTGDSKSFWSENKQVQVTVRNESELSKKVQARIDKFLEEMSSLMAARTELPELPQLFVVDKIRIDVAEADLASSSPGINYEKMGFAQDVLDYVPSPETSSGKGKAKRQRKKNCCFNCDSEDHGIADCPERRDHKKIAANKTKHRLENPSNGPTVRYHAEDDAKFSAFKPGVISDALADALGMRSRDLPPWIYRMRAMGYPPGYLQAAMESGSNMSIFDDSDNPDQAHSADKKTFNADKIIDYPGFNSPVPRGFEDMAEHNRRILCIQPHHEKENFIALLKQHVESHNHLVSGASRLKRSQEAVNKDQPAQKKQKVQSMDMELSDEDDEGPVKNDTDGSMLPPPPPIPMRDLGESEHNESTDSLGDLEKEREELLNKLAKGNKAGRSKDKSSELNQSTSATSKPRLANGDDSGTGQEQKTVQRQWSAVSLESVPGVSAIREGSFSTLTKAPSLETFQKGIVPFEAVEEQLPAQGKGWKYFKKMLSDLRKSKSDG